MQLPKPPRPEHATIREELLRWLGLDEEAVWGDPEVSYERLLAGPEPPEEVRRKATDDLVTQAQRLVMEVVVAAHQVLYSEDAKAVERANARLSKMERALLPDASRRERLFLDFVRSAARHPSPDIAAQELCFLLGSCLLDDDVHRAVAALPDGVFPELCRNAVGSMADGQPAEKAAARIWAHIFPETSALSGTVAVERAYDRFRRLT